MRVRVLIADDHQIMRQGLRSLIERETNMEVVAEARDGREAVKLAVETHPDVVIMDVAMPNLNGIEATRSIVENEPNTRVIALSMHADAQFIARMLEAGAAGYVLKDGAFEELTDAIRTVANGRRYLGPAVAHIVVDDYLEQLGSSEVSKAPQLTPREREVLAELADGKSTRETAAELDVSVKTIETHRHNIMEKLEIHSLAELTRYAVRHGLTGLGE